MKSFPAGTRPQDVFEPTFGIQIDPEDPPSGSLMEAEFSSFAPLPDDLVEFHDPRLFEHLWSRVAAAIRGPVEVATVGTELWVHVVGAGVLVTRPNGELEVRLWQCSELGHHELVEADPAAMFVHGRQLNCDWVMLLANQVAHEVRWVARAKGSEGELSLAPVYGGVVFEQFEACLKRRGELRSLRQRIADAAGIDGHVIRLAARIPRTTLKPHSVTVAAYNRVARHRQAFNLLEAETPGLIPLFGAVCDAPDFPTAGEPSQRLKTYLLARGLSERTWRLVAHADAQLLRPLSRFYQGDVAEATVAHLRLLDRLQLRRQSPLWFIEQLLAGWGDAGNRYGSFVGDVQPEIDAWCHVARLIEDWPEPDQRVRDELDQIRRWLIVKGRHLELTKPQRRAGWKWLLRRARAWEKDRRLQFQLDPRPWPVPFAVSIVGDWTFVALSNDIELLDEARAMYHCVDRYGPRCRVDGRVIISVRKQGRRVATVAIRFTEGAWKLVDAKGPCNSELADATFEDLDAFVRQIPASAPTTDRPVMVATRKLVRAEGVSKVAEEQRTRAPGDEDVTGAQVGLARYRARIRARLSGEME